MNNHMQAETWSLKRHWKCNFTILEEVKIVDRYLDGETFASIANGLGVARQSLWRMAKEVYNVDMYQTNGYPTHYDINTEVFENIDNEKSAYALGLIVSDGHVLARRGEIEFNSTDKELIRNMQECLETDKEPYIRYPQEGEINGRPIKAKKILYTLRVGPQKIKADFLRHFPARSEDTDNIPEGLRNKLCTRHLIRGIFDGDGCAHQLAGNARISFTGKERFLTAIRETIEHNLDKKMGGIYPKSNNNFFDYSISGSNNVKLLYHWLYDDAKFFLSRKKDILTNGLTLQ